MGIMSTLTSVLNRTANGVRDAGLTAEETENRTEAKKALEMVKIALITTSIASIFFFALFPTLFNLALQLTGIFACYEGYKIANNLLEIFESAIVELQIQVSDEALLNQITKNTYVMKPILSLAMKKQHAESVLGN